MSIIQYKFNGETYYTHQTWLSSRQRRAWHHIPTQNRNLAIYYTLSTLAVVAIGHRKIPMVSSLVKQFGFYTGTAVLGLGSWLGWTLALQGKSGSELTSVIETNDCFYTPFWKTQQSVVNLKQDAFKNKDAANNYVNRSKGRVSKREHIEKFNPDLILENPRAKQFFQQNP